MLITVFIFISLILWVWTTQNPDGLYFAVIATLITAVLTVFQHSRNLKKDTSSPGPKPLTKPDSPTTPKNKPIFKNNALSDFLKK